MDKIYRRILKFFNPFSYVERLEEDYHILFRNTTSIERQIIEETTSPYRESYIEFHGRTVDVVVSMHRTTEALNSIKNVKKSIKNVKSKKRISFFN